MSRNYVVSCGGVNMRIYHSAANGDVKVILATDRNYSRSQTC